MFARKKDSGRDSLPYQGRCLRSRRKGGNFKISLLRHFLTEMPPPPPRRFLENPEGKPPSDEGGGFRRRRKTEGEIIKKGRPQGSPLHSDDDINKKFVGNGNIWRNRKTVPLFVYSRLPRKNYSLNEVIFWRIKSENRPLS